MLYVRRALPTCAYSTDCVTCMMLLILTQRNRDINTDPWVGRSVCLFVCLFVCPKHNSKTNDPKVFKFGVGNDTKMSYKWYGFRVERSKVKVRVGVSGGLTAVLRGFELYECLLVLSSDAITLIFVFYGILVALPFA